MSLYGKDAMIDRAKEERKEGRMEGRKGGWKEGRKEGRKGKISLLGFKAGIERHRVLI